MSSPAGPHDDGFEVVVGDDGALIVPAAELARRGVRPGAHLRVVPEERRHRCGRMAGALRDAVPTEAVKQLIEGLDQAKAERAAYYRDSARQA